MFSQKLEELNAATEKILDYVDSAANPVPEDIRYLGGLESRRWYVEGDVWRFLEELQAEKKRLSDFPEGWEEIRENERKRRDIEDCERKAWIFWSR